MVLLALSSLFIFCLPGIVLGLVIGNVFQNKVRVGFAATLAGLATVATCAWYISRFGVYGVVAIGLIWLPALIVIGSAAALSSAVTAYILSRPQKPKDSVPSTPKKLRNR